MTIKENERGTHLEVPLEEYAGRRVIMLCETEREKRDFADLLGREGRAWKSGRSYFEPLDRFGSEGKPMVFAFNDGLRHGCCNERALSELGYTVLHCKNFYTDCGIEIELPFEELMEGGA